MILLIALGLSLSAINLFNLIQDRNSQPGKQDDVSNWESRLQPIKQKLPPGTNYIGYVADENLRAVWSPADGEIVEFYLTQYALSPVVVRRGVKYSWILGNFSSKDFGSWLAHSIGAYEIEDLGSGIYLIHRVAK